MKYTNEEMVSEILKRSDKVRDERRKKSSLYLGAASAVLLAALIAVIGFMPTGMSGGYTENTMYGAFLLGREAGGYVIVALLSFALGITVTLITQKYRRTGEGLGSSGKDPCA